MPDRNQPEQRRCCRKSSAFSVLAQPRCHQHPIRSAGCAIRSPTPISRAWTPGRSQTCPSPSFRHRRRRRLVRRTSSNARRERTFARCAAANLVSAESRCAAYSGAAIRIGRVPTGAPVSRSIVTGSISVPVSASKKRVTLPPPRCLRPQAPIANRTGRKSRPASVSTYSSRGGRTE